MLIPDLPAHGRSLETRPLEINDAARRLASLIEAKAQKRIAHIVAISIGAHVAATMALRPVSFPFLSILIVSLDNAILLLERIWHITTFISLGFHHLIAVRSDESV